MVNTCVVPGCNFSFSNRKRLGKESVSIHRFQKTKELRDAWIDAIHRENWEPTNASGVCSQHFTEDDMDLTGQTRRLRKGTVPSVFPSYPLCLQNRVIRRKPPHCEGNSSSNIKDHNSSSRERELMKMLSEKNNKLISARKKIKCLLQKVRHKEKQIKTDRVLIDSLIRDELIKINDNTSEMLKTSIPSNACCSQMRIQGGDVRSVFPSNPTNLQNRGTGKKSLHHEDNSSSIHSKDNSSSNTEDHKLTSRKRDLMDVLSKRNNKLISARKTIKVLQQKVRRLEKRIETDRIIIDSIIKY